MIGPILDHFDEDRADVYVSHEHIADPGSPAHYGFPVPPSRVGTAESYGLTVLAYILGSDVDVLGLLDLESLHLALHAARIAVASHDVLPLAVDRISAVTMAIHAYIGRLESASKIVESGATVAPTTAPDTDDTDGGSKVRNHAAPIAPAPSFALEF
jgi:hypothetical protein